MPDPTTISQRFQQNLQDLASQAQAMGQAVENQGQRLWNRPSGWSGNPLDIAGLTSAFDRTDLETSYAQNLSDPRKPGTVGAQIAIKIQGDQMATDERGLRARYATPVRCLVLAAARRLGHARPGGVLLGQVRYAQDILKAGSS